MKLLEHVDKLRKLIKSAFDKQFAMLGFGPVKQIKLEKLPQQLHAKRHRLEEMLENHKNETGNYEKAREKLVDELTFTLFNRIAAVKVMEAASLFPPIITKQPEHGDRSFGHKAWLEIRPDMLNDELDGIREYIKYAFTELGETLPLYSKKYPYALLPDTISLNEIIDTFNDVEKDPQIEDEIWQNDDIIGWLYESYNNTKKAALKDSKAKIEYDKVSLQSQVYTPRWVVQFLVENSLGKLYLEMYPGSEIKKRYKIANAPKIQERKPKPLHEIKLIDPSSGSGNFLLYAFDFFYELYIDQIENYDADYNEDDIPRLIIENNLHGIDLDDRAIQLAQIGLYIKARKKSRAIGTLNFKVVSSNFFLPNYDEIRHIFEDGNNLDQNQKELIEKVWGDLQHAYKFGSLIKLDEKLKAKVKTFKIKPKANQQGLLNEEKFGNQPKHIQQGLFNDEKFGLQPQHIQLDLFTGMKLTAMNDSQQKQFIKTFFIKLKDVVGNYAKTQGNTFLTSKTRDAITFLELLTIEYDVATSNPPYTDSSDFGEELKTFIETNYKKPYKFHTNLYATFIKRCYDFVGEHGFLAMVHPQTFMYIKTFEDVRKFIIDKTHINFFVEWGYLGMFNPSARVDSSMYILEKTKKNNKDAIFIKLNHLYETKRYDALFEAYDRYLNGEKYELLYFIPQSKLKIIKSWPFIYWISDGFREKFGLKATGEVLKLCSGLGTGDNNRFMRFWWEVSKRSISKRKNEKKWIFHAKGGPYNKWYGNLWLCIDWENNGQRIKKFPTSTIRNESYYFNEGISFAKAGSKTPSFRYIPNNSIFDSSSPAIFIKDYNNIFYSIAFLNSKLASYLLECLNPTAGMQVGDIERTPFVIPSKLYETKITQLSKSNIKIKKFICEFSLIELNFNESLLIRHAGNNFKQRIWTYFNYEKHLLTQVHLNEAIVNEKIFEIYDLSPIDKSMVIAKEGESIGNLPVLPEAKNAYLSEDHATKEFPLDNIKDFIQDLPEKEFTPEEKNKITECFPTLYQKNNDLEEFCIRHQVNPINVWYWFKESNVVPKQRMNDIAMEFLADLIREILMEDEDGIIPLVANAGEKILIDRLEEKFIEKGFTMAQYSSFDTVLGRPLNEYINKYFFAALSDHLNLFMYLPKTPFIWHISSGPEQGFDCYIIIYKWNRDKLMLIRSMYIEHRERALINRQSDLADNNSADAQNEKNKIFNQLNEIESFKRKIDELLTEGYNPILDDGVGKNIAPLQEKGMIPYEVLNEKQLKKYLNADW